MLAGLALLGISAPANAQTLTWSVVPSPNPAEYFNVLNGVSCASATACTAVGYHGNRYKSYTLVESWNGTSWSVAPSPDPTTLSDLEGVSCVSASACTAVGSYEISSGNVYTLVESWNGTSWSVVPSPSPGTGILDWLTGVSCVSASACTAVGYYYPTPNGPGPDTLVESWNGTSWSVVPSPSPGSNERLAGVSCASAGACMAVGYYGNPTSGATTLAESWNGTSWSVMPSRNPNRMYGDFLSGVWCASATTCTAVGQRSTTDTGIGKTLVESWNGTSWSVAPSPNRGSGSNLNGVSCLSATACTAVGRYYHVGSRPMIEAWDGTIWSVVPSAIRGNQSELNGVSCASATACTAAGYHNAGAKFKTLIEAGTVSG